MTATIEIPIIPAGTGRQGSLRAAFNLDRNNRLMAVANMLWGAGTGMYLAIWPLHLERLGATYETLGVLLGLSSALSILVAVPAASMATRLGWKRTLLVGWGLGPVGAALYTVADTWQAVVPGIICMALVALCGPAYLSYIGAAAHGQNLPRVFSLMGASITVGTILTSPIGGFLADLTGMRTVLTITTIFYALSYACVWWLDDLQPLHEVGTAVAPFGRWQAYRVLLGDRSLHVPVLGVLGLVGSAQIGVALAPTWLADTYGYTRSTIGVLGSVEALGTIALSVALGQMAARRGTSLAMALGAVLTVGAHLALLLADARSVGGLAYLLRGGAGTFHWIGSGAIGALLGRVALRVPGANERGFAIYYMAEGAVLAGSTVAAGLLYASWRPGPFVLSMGGLVVLTGAAIWRRSRGTLP